MNKQDELKARQREADIAVRKAGLRHAIRILATRKLQMKDDYDCGVTIFDGPQKMQVYARRWSGQAQVERWELKAQVDATGQVLYRETEREITIFKSGPWVERVVKAGEELVKELTAALERLEEGLAEENLANYEEVDF